MITVRQMYGLGEVTPADDQAHKTIEVIDDLSFSERATFAAAADGLAYYLTPAQTSGETVTAPDGTASAEPTYAYRRMTNAKRIALGMRVGGAILAPFIARRFGKTKRSGLETAGWAALGFFRPILGSAAAAVRGGSR